MKIRQTLFILTCISSSLFLIAAKPIERKPGEATLRSSSLLSELVRANAKPWLSHEANSEQRHPLYIGATPQEMEIEHRLAAHPVLRTKLKTFGERQLLKLAKKLDQSKVQIEAWPHLNEEGDEAWVFARWRANEANSWQWLSREQWEEGSSFSSPEAVLPEVLRPWISKERKSLFQDFLKMSGLYEKPRFGDAVWTSVDGKEVYEGWLPLEKLNSKEKSLGESKQQVARILPQPSRFNAEPVSFILEVSNKKVRWPSEIEWKDIPDSAEVSTESVVYPLEFPTDYAQRYREWVEKITVNSPFSTKRNSADPDHELEKVADSFENYYRSFEIPVKRERFLYRGKPQSNLIAKISGSLPGDENRPVLFADHYDTAFEEDTYQNSKKRVANPGADDNGTATASLLMAAKILKEMRPLHDIWLVHYTGEEYPADDLGARQHLGGLLKDGKNIQGLVLIDMVGIRRKKDPVFQINLGAPEYSRRMGGVALGSSQLHAKDLTPAIRGRYDELSYLYNTDGYIFSNLGFPVVYFNEHLNRKNIESGNPHYHNSTDIPKNVDFEYAVPISKTAIQTVWELANHK